MEGRASFTTAEEKQPRKSGQGLSRQEHLPPGVLFHSLLW